MFEQLLRLPTRTGRYGWCFGLLLLAFTTHALATTTITTFAGNLIPNGTATNVGVGASGVAIDSSDNVYFADASNHVIRKLTVSTGILTVIAGTGQNGFSGDGGAATSAQLNSPKGVAIDSSGNLYIADTSNHRIRKIDHTTGNISTIAGTGTGTFGGDGTAATAARVNSPQGVAADTWGNVYIADTSNNRVRKIDATTGNISTIAGNGTGGYLTDNVAATSTRINAPRGVVVDSLGNVYIADTSNNRIRKVSTGGTITTYAGTGVAGFLGDYGAATSARIRAPQALTLDSSGNLYIADTTNHRIRKVDSTTGFISTLTGTGSAGYGGDNGVATSGRISSPAGIAVDSSGNVYIGDTGNLRLRKIDATSGNITTAAGTGSATYGGDGGLATLAQFTNPQQIVIDGSGNFYLSDSGTHRVRKLATDGTVTTIAGTGVAGYSGDNGPATSAQLNTPLGIALDSSGNLYIADGNNNRIRKVATNGTITTFAGDGTGTFGGDNGPATSAQIFGPFGVLSIGTDLYITDTGNNRVRKVDAGGTITTIAGDGTANYGGDNGAATSAQFNTPVGITSDSAGNIYVTDYSNGSIRKISTGGIITTVAGNGANGYGGDGGAATSAQLNSPRAVAVDSSGNIYITDTTNSRIRMVDATTGNISTIVGDGNATFSGDGGVPASAQVSTPQAITIDSAGVIYFGDTGNRRFRRIGPPITQTLTYLGNGSTGGTVPTDPSSPYDSGSTVTVLGNTGSLLNTGYVLSSWNTAANGSGSALSVGSTFAIAANVTLYAQWTVSPIPSAPTAFNASSTGSTISLAWTNPTDLSLSSCMIRRSTVAYPTSITDGTLVATGLTGTSYSDTSLSDATYYYAIFALNSSGDPSASATATATVDTTPPSAPILSATKPIATGSTIDLSWNVPSTTATFTLRRSKDGGVSSIIFTGSSATSYSDTGLADGTYDYSIYALDSVGNTSNAGVSSTLTVDTTPPAAPVLSAAKPNATGSTIDLSWDVPSTAATFTLRRSTSAYPTSIIDGTLVQANIASSTTSMSETSLADGTYYYALFALDSFGNVSNAGTASAIVDTTAPSAPGAFIAVATSSAIALSWTNPSSDFASCTIRRSTSAYPASISAGVAVGSNLTAMTLNQTGLADGTYYYALFALDAFGNVSNSATASATVDTFTDTPTLTAPASSATDNASFALNYSLPEAGMGGSVLLTFTRTGGVADAGSPHVLTLVSSLASVGGHAFSLNAADFSADNNVVAHTGGAALVDGAIYTVTLAYQDALGNTAATVANTGVTYDNTTAAPTLTTPATNSADNATYAVAFNLPEAAMAGSVSLTFTRTGGTADAGSPHALTLAGSLAGAATHTATLNAANFSTDASVASLSGGAALVDGAIYTVTLAYQDAIGNPTAAATSTGVTYDISVATPAAPALSAGNDSGFSSTDGITNINAPRIEGTAEADGMLEIFVDSTFAFSLALDGTGNWWFDRSPAFTDGVHTVATRVIDRAGNVSATSSPLTLTIDTVAPSAPGSLTAAATGSTIALSWTNPASDFASCTIRRSTSTYPTSISSGTAVASGLTGTTCTDTSLADGKYYYAIFALDTAGNVSASATASATADAIAPTVQSVHRTASSYPTNAATISFTVTFSEAVAGVDVSDFALTATGTAAGSVASVSGSGATRQVVVGSLTGQGAVRLDVKSSGTGIIDAANNALSGGFAAGETYTIDRTVPAAFDLAGYFSRYPDIAALYGSDPYAAWVYYRDHGIYLGEVFDGEFRVEEYLGMYPDLLAAYGTDLTGALVHWLTTGRTEGRLGRIPVAFDAQGYLNRNPDVAAAVGGSLTLAWRHFWSYGIYEGREYNDEFNAFEYLAINADLTAVYVDDWRAGTLHWLRYGRLEGRLGSVPQLFDVATYLTRNPDVAAVWGTDPTTVFLHFWLYGIDESRTFDDEFRVDEYLALNPTLAAVYGSDRRGAFKHWVRYGRAEGRLGKNP